MTQVNSGITKNTSAWDGRSGMPIPPTVAHLFKERGIQVFKRSVDDVQKARMRGLPREWIRTDPDKFLMPVDNNGERAPMPEWYWCAPTPFALLARAEGHDDSLAVALWAPDKIGLKALDAMYRLSGGGAPGEYVDQVRAMYHSGFYEKTEGKSESSTD